LSQLLSSVLNICVSSGRARYAYRHLRGGI
jgi:hypothetical protein